METYEVQLSGRNLRLTGVAGESRYFETRCLLAASNGDEALALARRRLENHPQLHGRLVNPPQDPPLLFVQLVGSTTEPPDAEPPVLLLQRETDHASSDLFAGLLD